FIVGGVGSLLYDLWLGKAATMVVSLLIHGLQAATVSALLHFAFKKFKRETLWAGISSVAGALIVIAGYFLFYWLFAEAVLSDGKTYGIAYAALRIPRNIIQEIIGVTVAMVICYATTFKKQLKKVHLLPDFTGEMIRKKAPQTEPETTLSE
ncbi:MAG: ECF transporter S component, partial [Clostridia bacterium]|nr:ECF transporter S component [Clostridia bacterium]